MKTKAKIILKSLAELPANTLTLAASVPGRAMTVTRHMLAPPARATRRQFRAARERSAKIFRDIYARAHTPMRNAIPWSRIGLNE
jgi:hypothetical protein